MRRNDIKQAPIVIDEWKLSIFEHHLSKAGYSHDKDPGLTPDTLILTVKTENLEALAGVVLAANTEATRTGDA